MSQDRYREVSYLYTPLSIPLRVIHAVATGQETEQRGLEELVDEQADATGLVDTLLDKIRKSQELTLNDENLMQQVLENQKQIEEKAKQLIEDMKKTAEKWNRINSSTLRRSRNIKKLQDLMEKALSEEHKELYGIIRGTRETGSR
ncbi:hypothetical protein GBAR_LOCUS9212 [Geodia barretti]|uniref:Uncharacterized protein n=1 Tax=Geodia barretti TaxID=519541 RepID=A0AA35RR18_GEOBA|nr:hypothetical protein GBAR_LOCUS9212 [Geodia barretti]